MTKKKLSRRELIVKLVDERQYVSIDDLVKEFNVSYVTMRRDLSELEKNRFLIRKFGGAASIKDYIKDSEENSELVKNESEVITQDNQSSLTKKQIAYQASKLIKSGTRIIIDAGSTTGEILNYLHGKEKLAIMTNSLQIGYKLSQLPFNQRPKIMLTGGTYDQSADTFQGVIIKEVLKSYNFEQLFIGADGIDINLGTMTINEGENYSEVMASISKEVIVLIESSKFGRRMPKLELPWSKITTIITDSGISQDMLDILNNLNINVIVANDQVA